MLEHFNNILKLGFPRVWERNNISVNAIGALLAGQGSGGDGWSLAKADACGDFGTEGRVRCPPAVLVREANLFYSVIIIDPV